MLWVDVKNIKNSKFPSLLLDTEPDLERCSPGTRIPQGVCAGKCDQEGHPFSLTGGRKGQEQGLSSVPTAPYPKPQVKGTSDGPGSPPRPLPPVSSAPARHRQPYLSATASCHLRAFAGHVRPMPQCPNPSDYSGGSGPLSSSARWVGRSPSGTWPPHTSGSGKTTAAEEVANTQAHVGDRSDHGSSNRGGAERPRVALAPRQTRLS